MKIDLKTLSVFLAASAMVTISIPANAQYMGSDGREVKTSESASKSASVPTHQLSRESQSFANPQLQETSKISQPSDPAVIDGINTAGTVRVNMLSNLEALLSICGNGAQLTGIIWGACLLWACLRRLRKPGIGRAFAFAMLPIILGVCTPASIDWVIASARDVNLFS